MAHPIGAHRGHSTKLGRVAERPSDGSRGFQVTDDCNEMAFVAERRLKTGPALMRHCPTLSARHAQPWDSSHVRWMNLTATIVASLRDSSQPWACCGIPLGF